MYGYAAQRYPLNSTANARSLKTRCNDIHSKQENENRKQLLQAMIVVVRRD